MVNRQKELDKIKKRNEFAEKIDEKAKKLRDKLPPLSSRSKLANPAESKEVANSSNPDTQRSNATLPKLVVSPNISQETLLIENDLVRLKKKIKSQNIKPLAASDLVGMGNKDSSTC